MLDSDAFLVRMSCQVPEWTPKCSPMGASPLACLSVAYRRLTPIAAVVSRRACFRPLLLLLREGRRQPSEIAGSCHLGGKSFPRETHTRASRRKRDDERTLTSCLSRLLQRIPERSSLVTNFVPTLRRR